MRVDLMAVMIIAGLMWAGSVQAADGGALVQKANCMGCHASDKAKFGPSFKLIADKYRGDKSAQTVLEKKVRSGGRGVWGNTPMPPTSAAISDSDIKDMVQWILSQK